MSDIITIDKSAYGGTCLSLVDGKILFTPFVIPGEQADVEIMQDKKDFAFARPRNIITSSPDRISPECPNFSRCGGCDYLHMNYERERDEKKNIIIDSLTRIGKLHIESIPVIKTLYDNRFHYRSHARIKSADGTTGFFGKDSHTIIPFPSNGCLLLNEEINSFIVTAKFNRAETPVAIDDQCTIIAPRDGRPLELTETVNGIRYHHSTKSFFQRNMLLRSKMIDRVMDYAGDDKNANILELGCGCGFFSLPLAGRFHSVRGIDIDGESIRFARKNASENGITNSEFIKLDDAFVSGKERAEIIVADPPRAGLSENTRRAITSINPSRIIYISCNPSTWARDLKYFREHGFDLKEATLIDMFPGTMHIEIISLLAKQAS
ncbi:MAG TPA: methyltransferase domain-containing protein [Spirochaetota bacterium]